MATHALVRRRTVDYWGVLSLQTTIALCPFAVENHYELEDYPVH